MFALASTDRKIRLFAMRRTMPSPAGKGDHTHVWWMRRILNLPIVLRTNIANLKGYRYVP